MAIVRALISIGIIIVSFLVGYLFFYVVSDGTKEQKKNHIEESTSQLINVVIFTWIGKIVLNIQMFIKDPLVILAYPSNSHAFYFGIGCVAVTLAYKSMKGKVALFPLVHAFVPIFLAASLTYEFIQIVVKEQAYS